MPNVSRIACVVFILFLPASLVFAPVAESQPGCQTICQEGNSMGPPSYICVATALPHNCTACIVTCPALEDDCGTHGPHNT